MKEDPLRAFKGITMWFFIAVIIWIIILKLIL